MGLFENALETKLLHKYKVVFITYVYYYVTKQTLL